MSRNGSGTYSAPVNSWNPQTAGVSATAADFGALLTDLAAALTQSVSADGQTAVTGSLAMGGNKLTGLGAGTATGNSLRWEQLFSQGTEADIASATTTDIGGQNTNFLRVTGTVGITSFGTNYNGPRFLRFEGALTLTHDATTLILPGAANITTAAGDIAIVVPKASAGTANGWQVFYQRASALAVVAGPVTTSGLTQATARMLGRTTGGTGAIEELTAAQVSAFAAAASDTAQGVVELATTAEVQAGTDTARAVTPAAMQAGKLVSIGQTALSGSETIITGIPSWAKRVTILLDVASANATSIISLRLGDAGGIESSGYAGVVGGGVTGSATIAQTSTSGFQINMTGLDFASNTYTARITLDLMDAASFKWVCSGTVYPNTGTATSLAMTGYKSTSAALDRISLVTSAGTFDGGSIQVTYE